MAPLTIGPDTWTKDPRVQAEHVPNSSQWNLVIERVGVADGGQYECQVSRRRTTHRHMVTLIVRGNHAARHRKLIHTYTHGHADSER